MCLKWTNGSNECSKSATDKMYIQCKVKAPYILLVQNVIKIISKLIVGQKKPHADVYPSNV